MKLLAGQLPSPELLESNELTDYFGNIAEAVKTGSPELLHESLVKHEEFFIETSIFLIIEKLKNVIYRNLFKSIMVMHAPEARFPITHFQTALSIKGTEMEIDEVPSRSFSNVPCFPTYLSLLSSSLALPCCGWNRMCFAIEAKASLIF